MWDLYLRELKEVLLEPIVRAVARVASANQLTLVAFALGVCCVAAVAGGGGQMLSITLWVLNRTVDGLDGSVARLTRTSSDFGAYLDILCDFVIYAALPIALTLPSVWPSLWSSSPSSSSVSDGNTSLVLSVAVLQACYFVNAASLFCLSSILEKRSIGAKARKELTTVAMPAGLIEGGETVLFYTAFLLSSHRPDWLEFLFYLFAFLVAITSAQRLVWAYQTL
jgi:phosphatidylglycerophosphate synthase